MTYLHSLWLQPYNISGLVTFQHHDKMSPAVQYDIMSPLMVTSCLKGKNGCNWRERICPAVCIGWLSLSSLSYA